MRAAGGRQFTVQYGGPNTEIVQKQLDLVTVIDRVDKDQGAATARAQPQHRIQNEEFLIRRAPKSIHIYTYKDTHT